MDESTDISSDLSDDQSTATSATVSTELLLHYLEEAERNLAALREALAGEGVVASTSSARAKAAQVGAAVEQEGMRVVEGVFDGQNMVGPDGKQYSVPANYASKSKLVEGDVLKLSITRDGSFIYKQIGPVDRQRLIGELVRDAGTSEYKVLAGGKAYKILLASVTYFKGEAGDEVVVLVPQDGDTRWAAVENIIKKAEQVTETPEG